MPNEFLDAIAVVPYDDIRAGHDYLVAVLGFTSGGLVEMPDGTVVHGEVRAGDRRIWLHRAEGGMTTPNQAGALTGGVVIHVADVDAHFARTKAAGADIVREPTDEDYGQREYDVRDPAGHHWYFATPTSAPAAR
jgi:MerR family transcriptional regulator, thiopeptide resistance regulator